MAGGYCRTGDVASRDDGYITFIGRTDDVFKSSDYKVSPFELESGYRYQGGRRPPHVEEPMRAAAVP
jgi:long-subunit acyl-CoA synthetase (AMP-forming)